MKILVGEKLQNSIIMEVIVKQIGQESNIPLIQLWKHYYQIQKEDLIMLKFISSINGGNSKMIK